MLTTDEVCARPSDYYQQKGSAGVMVSVSNEAFGWQDSETLPDVWAVQPERLPRFETRSNLQLGGTP
jgi:hypothetical protein